MKRKRPPGDMSYIVQVRDMTLADVYKALRFSDRQVLLGLMTPELKVVDRLRDKGIVFPKMMYTKTGRINLTPFGRELKRYALIMHWALTAKEPEKRIYLRMASLMVQVERVMRDLKGLERSSDFLDKEIRGLRKQSR